MLFQTGQNTVKHDSRLLLPEQPVVTPFGIVHFKTDLLFPEDTCKLMRLVDHFRNIVLRAGGKIKIRK